MTVCFFGTVFRAAEFVFIKKHHAALFLLKHNF